MNEPFWKKVLSYVIDVPVESTSSEYNDALFLKLSRGRYQLCTPDAIYSWADKYDNYALSFSTMELDRFHNADVLILGFGLGSIPYMLENNFDKKYSYTGVDIDPEVIRLAGKYVLSELKSPVTLIQADAMQYLMSSTLKFDIIASDIFINDSIPDQYLSENYFNTVKNRLLKHGVFMMNMLYRTASDKKIADHIFGDVFLKCFPAGDRLRVRDNMMLFNRKDIIIHKKETEYTKRNMD
jgi:predicted membrane-bound spermidine synthase